MDHILIIDDDADFIELLKDIYEQSNYVVTTAIDPHAGFEQYCTGKFDLVVTDQKMPGLTGDQLIRKMREVRDDVPIVMVSGYLDNETIRSLIREGVHGVFLKPLNVFSLLKKSASLIEVHRNHAVETGKVTHDDNHELEKWQPPFDFPFHTFPCKADVSREFAKKLFASRNFKSNLLLHGQKGTPLESIIGDLNNFETGERDSFHIIPTGDVSAEVLFEAIKEAQRRRCTRMTLVVSHPETLDEEQTKLLYAVAKATAPFENNEFPVRCVFFLTEDTDKLYDSGAIDDDLYMFMGTTEIRVPAIREIPDDIPIIAYRMMKETAQDSQVPYFDSRGKIFLREHEWRGNFAEMSTFCTQFVGLGKTEITREDIEAVAQRISASHATYGELHLKHQLKSMRDDYCLAVLRYFNYDAHRAGGFLQADPNLLAAIGKSHCIGLKKS